MSAREARGDEARDVRVVGLWPSERRESWTGLVPDRTLELKQDTGEAWEGSPP